METTRINKRMAELGLCSRREADALIDKGAVTVNGKPAKMGQQVSVTDKISVKGGSTKKREYLAYYKGRGIITHSPAEHETDVAMRLEKDYGITDLYPVGRLDKDSEGLMIITNDGRVTGPLLDPDSDSAKEYEVTVDKPTNGWFAKHMESGVKIERYTTKPANITLNPKNKLRFTLTLTEGKKHQIRRMCAALGYQVQDLKRTRISNITLGSLKPNQYRKITGDELKEFLQFLKIK